MSAPTPNDVKRWRARATQWAVDVSCWSIPPTAITLARGLGHRGHPKARVQRRLFDAIEPLMVDYAAGDVDAREAVFRSVADVLTA